MATRANIDPVLTNLTTSVQKLDTTVDTLNTAVSNHLVASQHRHDAIVGQLNAFTNKKQWGPMVWAGALALCLTSIGTCGYKWLAVLTSSGASIGVAKPEAIAAAGQAVAREEESESTESLSAKEAVSSALEEADGLLD